MVCGIAIPVDEQIFNLVIFISSIVSVQSASFLVLGIIDAWNDDESAFEDSTKKAIRNLLCMLSVSDLAWSFSTAFYVFLQMFVAIGNMGYCSIWYCVANRAWHHFFSFMNIITTFCISLYIFIGFFFPHYTKGNNQAISLLFLFPTIMISLLDVLVLLSVATLKVAPSGWCEPPDQLWFYMDIPILVVFALILVLNFICIIKFLSLSEKMNLDLSFASRRLLGYVLAFFIMWLPTVIWIGLDMYTGPVEPQFWASVIRIITNCSNGTIDLLVYGLVNDSFRKRYNSFFGQALLYWLLAPFLLLYSLHRYLCGCYCRVYGSSEVDDFSTNDYLTPKSTGTHMVNYSEDHSSRSVTDHETQ